MLATHPPAAALCLLLTLSLLPGCACRIDDRQAVIPAFDVMTHGAVGDGVANDAPAIQRAIDACAASGGGRVVLSGKRTYRSGTIALKNNVTLHLDKAATLLASDRREDYRDDVLIDAREVRHIGLSGEGTIEGQSRRFMAKELPHIFRAGPWRPAVIRWAGCSDIAITGITIHDAPQWTIHLAGCERVTIEGIRILNDLRVPNCDGIDVDRCRDVTIRRCTIRAGDDCIVLKTTKKYEQYGPIRDVRISDCELESTSCALKLGSETFGDMTGIRFESCRITASNRGLGIMLRDSGNLSDISFSKIDVHTRLNHEDWWGKAEPIYVTALPRTADTKLGRISNVRFIDITCRGENGAYLAGSATSPLKNITLERIRLHIDKTTQWPGGTYDRRPTSDPTPPPARIAGIWCEQAESVRILDCTVEWGQNRPDSFGPALETHNVKDLTVEGLEGDSAHPGRVPARVIEPQATPRPHP